LVAEPKAAYAEDIDFLLAEFEKKAGHFFAAKKIDWKKVSEQFRTEAKDVADDVAHVKLCARLLARLRDGHASIRDLKVTMPDEAKGRRWAGPHVQLITVGDKVLVRRAFKEAEAAGVKAGMEVMKIDGKPARAWLDAKVSELSDRSGYSTDHQALYAACHWGLGDWDGTKITLVAQNDATGGNFTLTRSGGSNFVPVGPLFPPAGLKGLGRQSYGKTKEGFGYIHLRDVPGNLDKQLDTMLGAIGEVPGMILDCRANGGGGCDHAAVFGRFLATGQRWRNYVGQGANPFTGPLVVIVDAGTRSAGETVSGQFGEDGRALIIGDTPTAGMSSSKVTVKAPSGLFSAYFSVHSNKARFNGGKGIEGVGVLPMLETPYEIDDLRKGVDTQIRRAEELLKAGLPKDKVAFERERK
jgi:carboxyl-terminal processing protease